MHNKENPKRPLRRPIKPATTDPEKKTTWTFEGRQLLLALRCLADRYVAFYKSNDQQDRRVIQALGAADSSARSNPRENTGGSWAAFDVEVDESRKSC